VLSWEDTERVSIARRHSAVETSFQTESPSANDHVRLIIVYVRPEGASDKWLTGYGVGADFTEVCEVVGPLKNIVAWDCARDFVKDSCNEKPSRMERTMGEGIPVELYPCQRALAAVLNSLRR
jgi:hypothetical protein